MKSPLWIITSILAIILVALFAFILYSMSTLFVRPHTASIAVRVVPEIDIKKAVEPADLSLIYSERDLFGTHRPAIVSVKPVDTLPVIPPPPQPIPVKKAKKPALRLLDPLPFKITGIIASNNETNSQVSLMNTNTRRTGSYKVGDKVLDAFILRIFPRKIFIVRSNGQQETLYLYPEEAQLDKILMQDTTWADVIQRQSERSYLVNPTAFGARIHSLAELIEILDLTTASRSGIPTGIRIGKMKKTSFGFAAGFLPGDIIMKIAHIAPTSTSNRMKLFNTIIQSDLGKEITVEFMRNDSLYTTTFTLFNLADPTAVLEKGTMMPLRKESPAAPVKKTRSVTAELPAKPVAPVQPTAVTIPEKNQQTTSPTQKIVSSQIAHDNKQRDLDAMQRFGGKPASMIPPAEKPTKPIGS